MAEINATAKYAVDERKDDPSKNSYKYWAGREKGHAPRGRGYGAKEGQDFGKVGETTKQSPTEIKERAEANQALASEEVRELRELLKAKTQQAVELQDAIDELKKLLAQHATHGDLYGTQAVGKFNEVMGMLNTHCRIQKISPTKVEPPPNFKRSFEQFVAGQSGYASSSVRLPMDS